MGARYLAISWRAEDPASRTQVRAARVRLAAVQGWTLALERVGLCVWTSSARPLPVGPVRQGESLVIGWSASAPDLAGLPPMTAAARLADLTWGSYVAILREGSSSIWAFRDPSGALDALTWRCGALCLLADDLEGLPVGLEPPQLALDWASVAELIRWPVAAAGRSALHGLHSVSPGSLHPLGEPPSKARPIWTPSDVARRSAPAQPEAHLREAVDTAVRGLAGRGPRLLLEISGGLDSAIVAASLAAQGLGARAAQAVNQYVTQREGDERGWAKEVAARAAIPLRLVEKPVGALTESDFTELAGSVRPPTDALDSIRDRRFVELASACGAGAVMTGQGGDAVFYQMPSPAIAADLARARGLGALFGAEGQALARWLRRSVWSLALERGRSVSDLGHLGPRFWGEAVRRAPPRTPHRWLAPDSLAGLPPGKQLQALHLAYCQLKFGRSWRGEALEMLHPLLAQPAVEAALRIPSFELVRGGRDRGLARAAFADRLPSSVAQRASKGALARLYTQRVAASVSVLRPWLLDGLLAQAGVLDRKEVEAALTPEDLIWRGDGFRLLQAAQTEGWARAWRTRSDGASSARSRWSSSASESLSRSVRDPLGAAAAKPNG